MSATCGSCRAPIVWATTHAGRNMPLDGTPSPDPTSLRAWRDDTGTVLVRDIDGIGSTEIPTDAHYATSHFSTCPESDKHRRKKVSKQVSKQVSKAE